MLADKKTAVEKQEKEAKKVVDEQPVIDKEIDLSVTRKQRLRIDGDNSRVVELDLSDMGIISRLTDSYPKLEKLQEKAIKMSENATGEDFDEVKLGKDLKTLDKEMRGIIDYIFDSNVSEVCAPSGTMYDPFGGKCRYEHIIEKLVEAYDANISAEAKKLNTDGIEKHTKGYNKRK